MPNESEINFRSLIGKFVGKSWRGDGTDKIRSVEVFKEGHLFFNFLNKPIGDENSKVFDTEEEAKAYTEAIK